MLFNLSIVFLVLFILSIFLINPGKKAKEDTNVRLKSDLMITMEWQNNSVNDVDLFVQIPTDEVIYFGRRDVSGMSLDRDDRGTLNDRILMPDGSYNIIRENWEHVFVRKALPGNYIINVYLYSKRAGSPSDVVKVKVERLSPYQLIFHKRVILSDYGQEETIVQFSIDKHGRVESISETPEDVVIRTQYKRGGH